MIFAVISGVFSTCVVLILGTYEVFNACLKLFSFIQSSGSCTKLQHEIIQHVVNSIDMYLTSTVLLIFSVGLYELFIQKFDDYVTNYSKFNVLVVHNLDQLKSKLIQTIIMILVVEFFKKATQMIYSSPLDLIYLSVGIFLISLSVYFTHSKN
jgi:uncharacterized membrane protein YqhA